MAMDSLPHFVFGHARRRLMPATVQAVPQPSTEAPVNTVEPALAAGITPRVGQAIGRTLGTWTGAASVAAWWVLDGVQVADALVDATYTPVLGDVGKYLAVHEVATSPSGIVATAITQSREVIA